MAEESAYKSGPWSQRGIPGRSPRSGEPMQTQRPKVPHNILMRPLTLIPPMVPIHENAIAARRLLSAVEDYPDGDGET